MSEQLSHDPVMQALDLEKEIAQKLEQPTDAARSEVRRSMEKWLEIVEQPKIGKQYKEELGELDPEIAKAEILTSIHNAFPVIAKNLGWKPEMKQQLDMNYNQAA